MRKYAKHLAWLHTVPTGRGASRAQQFKGTISMMMPPIIGGEHVLSIIGEVGYAIAGEPLTFQELESWCNLTGTRLDGWTASMVVAMSRSYMGQRVISADERCPAPYYP